MMKRVLLGLYEQKALHALCDRLWPDQVSLARALYNKALCDGLWPDQLSFLPTRARALLLHNKALGDFFLFPT